MALLAFALGGCGFHSPPPLDDSQDVWAQKLSDPVAKSVADSGVIAPRRRLSRLLVQSLQADGRLQPNGAEEKTLRALDANSLYAITRKSEERSASEVSFLGLISLQSRLRSIGSDWSSRLTGMALQGDWRDMPIGSRLGIAATLDSHFNTIFRTVHETYPQEPECLVVTVVPASALHNQLLGNAKKLNCSSNRPQPGRADIYYFLEDYGFAVRMETRFDGKLSGTSRIIEVAQE